MSSVFSRNIYSCLLALMLIIVRTGDAHAHLCADGKEPRNAIHVGDGGNHPCVTDEDADAGHSGDRDVPIGQDLVLKKAPQADPWAPALVLFACSVAAQLVDEGVEFDTREPRVESVTHLRPPLRGPPA